MLLDLSKLRARREHIERTVPPSAFDPPEEDYRVAAPVELVMDVDKATAATFRVTGHMKAALELECGRCLEPFALPVHATFELRYLPLEVDAATEAEREITDDDLTTAFYKDGTLDILDLMREQFLLALPMKPLCVESCRGLCSHCGANLNRGECGHKTVWEDPRLAPLKKLLNRDQEN